MGLLRLPHWVVHVGPGRHSPSPRQQGHVGPDHVRPLPESSVLPVRSVELLQQIEQAGEHSGATAPRIALPHAGIPDTASPPPLTPPSHAPHLAKGQPALGAVGTLFASAAFTPASALYRSQSEVAPTTSDQSPSSLLPEQPRLSFSLPEPASQVKPAAADPTPPESLAPTAGSPPPPPSPLQLGEPFVPDLDVSAY